MEVEGAGGGTAATAAAAAPKDNSDLLTKQKEAAVIANQVLAGVIDFLAPGKSIADVCEFGDTLIDTLTANVYKNKKMEKGIAFPCCISVNECVGHHSPLKTESKTLNDGDVVKIDLGVHLDGSIALVAHTVVLGASGPITGPKADVIAAAHTAAEVALRLIKPGASTTAVTEAFEKVAEAYGVRAIPGMYTHQLSKYLLDEGKKIPLKSDPEAKNTPATFALYESYAIDVAFSTGDAKPRETESRTTVFKRNPEVEYHLKMKASRSLLTEISKRFAALPFSLRALGDETQARLGVKECVEHGLLTPYRVEYERDGDIVAHARFTVLLLAGGTQKITGMELPSYIQSAKVLPADVAEVLKTVPFVSKKKGAAGGAVVNNNKPGSAVGAGGGMDTTG